MATYEELIAAARTAQAEGRGESSQALATRAYELRTGRPFSSGDIQDQEDAYDPTESEGLAQ